MIARRLRAITLGVAAVAVGMVVASCSGSDSDSVTVAPAVTFATVPPTVPVTVPPTSAPELTAPAGAAATPPAASASTTNAPPPGPLVEPKVGLLDIGTFDQPVDIAVRPGDSRVFVVEQTGKVIAVDDESGSTSNGAVVADVTDRITSKGNEQGLLGLAFHPDKPLAYLDYTNRKGDTVVAEFAVDPATGVFDPASFREVLTVDQPYENHNGGKLLFGPDGMLYIGLGDGGSGGDPQRHALDVGSRLGKILRIDPLVSGTAPFTVPPDNPFVGVAGADPTIWALGLRNPWRFSFDAANGDLWIADVGQDRFEEVDHAPAIEGANAGRGLSFGWSAIEGDTSFNSDQPTDNQTPPVYVYPHDDGHCSISGGTVARVDTVNNLAGWYVFGDYCGGEIWALDPSSTGDAAGAAPRIVTLAKLPALAAVSAGPNGEIYAISNEGTVYRLTNA